VDKTLGLIPITVVALALTAGFPAAGSEEIAEQQSLECQVCHADVEADIQTLTDRGLYFQFVRTLDGYEQVLEKFQSCTYCHADRAGSQHLTSEGYRFRWMMEDMAGLRAWLEEHHPRPANEDESADDPD
jgi:hypothetical protein